MHVAHPLLRLITTLLDPRIAMALGRRAKLLGPACLPAGRVGGQEEVRKNWIWG